MKSGYLYLKFVLFAAIVLCVFMAFSGAVSRLSEGNDDRSAEQLERSLRRSIAAYYATTGTYPGVIDDVISRYGIQVDEDKYDILYMPVAENLAPSLDVVRKQVDAG